MRHSLQIRHGILFRISPFFQGKAASTAAALRWEARWRRQRQRQLAGSTVAVAVVGIAAATPAVLPPRAAAGHCPDNGRRGLLFFERFGN